MKRRTRNKKQEAEERRTRNKKRKRILFGSSPYLNIGVLNIFLTKRIPKRKKKKPCRLSDCRINGNRVRGTGLLCSTYNEASRLTLFSFRQTRLDPSERVNQSAGSIEVAVGRKRTQKKEEHRVQCRVGKGEKKKKKESEVEGSRGVRDG